MLFCQFQFFFTLSYFIRTTTCKTKNYSISDTVTYIEYFIMCATGNSAKASINSNNKPLRSRWFECHETPIKQMRCNFHFDINYFALSTRSAFNNISAVQQQWLTYHEQTAKNSFFKSSWYGKSCRDWPFILFTDICAFIWQFSREISSILWHRSGVVYVPKLVTLSFILDCQLRCYFIIALTGCYHFVCCCFIATASVSPRWCGQNKSDFFLAKTLASFDSIHSVTIYFEQSMWIIYLKCRICLQLFHIDFCLAINCFSGYFSARSFAPYKRYARYKIRSEKKQCTINVFNIENRKAEKYGIEWAKQKESCAEKWNKGKR